MLEGGGVQIREMAEQHGDGGGSEDLIRLEQSVWEVTACKFFAGQYFEG